MNRVLSPPVMPAAFEAHHADVNGTRLCYVRGGSGDPIVLLHGWPQTWWAWRQIIPALAARGRTVIVPDLRGVGGSEKAIGGYGKANQAEDIRQLVRGLGFDRIDLVGHDIGGMVAYAYACAHPGEVKRLVLVDLLLPALGLEASMDPARGGSFHFGFFMVPDLAESLIEGREDAFFGWWFRRSLGRSDDMSPEGIEHYARIYAGHEALAAGFAHYRTLLQDIQHDRPFATTKLPMPVLAVAGERSVGAKLADGLRPATSNLRSVVLPACGHFVPEERPRELSRLLVEFLELDAVGAPEAPPVHPVTIRGSLMPYEVPALPYAYEALEPVIDAETMRLHHDKHHQACVDALNKALEPHPELQGKTIEDLLRGLDGVPEAIRTQVRNQGGGHANHQLFWKIMAPPGQGGGGEPDGDLAKQVNADFGSLQGMKDAFAAAAAKRFGSGWVFLLFDPKAGKLEIETTANQDSALLLGKPALLGNDLWEHAYYLKHRNQKPEYLKAWWGVVNWPYVGERLAGIHAGKQQL